MTVASGPDPWGYGKNPNGRLDNKYLRASYPYVETDYRDSMRIAKILSENFGHTLTLHRLDYVFFITREDANLFRTLLLIYPDTITED